MVAFVAVSRRSITQLPDREPSVSTPCLHSRRYLGGKRAATFTYVNTKMPWIKFWPSDWLSDEALRLVSVGARGLWIDMICLMAKSERTGYLQVNGGVNPTLNQVGKLVGLSMSEIEPLISELMQAGVCSIEDKTGIVYSRRMVRDRAAYEQACEFGKKGGNPRLKGVKGRVKLNRQPSLASSTSILHLASGSESEALKIYEAYPKKTQRAHALKAIIQALSKKPFEELLRCAWAYNEATKSWPPDRRQFIPHPASWFNAESYEDDQSTWLYIPKDTTVSWQRKETTDEDHAKGF